MTKDNPLNLPWRIEEDEGLTVQADKHCVADCSVSVFLNDAAKQANAAYIVHACNMFPELVSMLERILENNMVFETSKIEELLERAKNG